MERIVKNIILSKSILEGLTMFTKKIRKFFCGIYPFFILIIGSVDLYSAPLIVNPQHHLRKSNRSSHISFKTNFAQYTGNTEIVQVNGGLVGTLVGKNHLMLALAEGSYGEKSKERYIKKSMGHLRYVYEFGKWFGVESFTQIQYDEFRRIDIRALGGLGPRFTIFVKGLLELSAGSSYFYEYNRNNEASFSDSGEVTKFNRWSNYIHLDLYLTKSLSFVSTTYWQPRFDDFNDYRLFNSNLLKLKLKPFLNFFLQVSIVFDSRPPKSVKDSDTVFKSGVQFILKAAKQKKQEKKEKQE